MPFANYRITASSADHHQIIIPHDHNTPVNANVKNAIYAVAAVLVTVPALHYAGDYVQFHRHMMGLGIDDGSYCDAACAAERMTGRYDEYEEGYTCVEVSPDRYVCRPPRGAYHLYMEDYPPMYAAVPNQSHGEIFFVAANDSDRGFYHVGEVVLVDEPADRIAVNFYARAPDGGYDVVHVAEMSPGDTYVECFWEWQNVFHLVEYTGTFDRDGTAMAEFWAGHIWPRPPELSPCDPKKVISRSLQIDYDLGLPPYEEFERAFMEKQSRQHGPLQ